MVSLASDFFTVAEAALVIARAEQAGFKAAKLVEEGRRNSEVFLRDAEIRGWVSRGLRQTFGLSFAAVPNVFECYRYPSGASVASHADAATAIGDRQSQLTLVVYLNDGFEGGFTSFPELGLEVEPKAGAALMFAHGLIHDGSKVESGTKYILRTAVALKT